MLEWLSLFAQIMLINIVLSGDNAVVIAMASKNLPPEQRRLAIWWGAFGAVALRLVLTVAAVLLLKIPYIQAIGSVLLLWIAVKLLIEEQGHASIAGASALLPAIKTIIAADFIMSLDNVLAIAAKAKGDLLVIVVGIALSIPIIIWGSTLVAALLHKFPVFIYLGAAILGYTAGEMLLGDNQVIAYLPQLPHWVIPVLGAVGVIAAGMVKRHSWKV